MLFDQKFQGIKATKIPQCDLKNNCGRRERLENWPKSTPIA